VPATFFIVGENALTERGLLQRMIREGHEVGSHTYTHPNLATVGKTQTLFELNTTQRLFQAFTGRTLKLFRAPFFGDAEPTTADEILPVWDAQNRGYISVGLHVDSEDWQRPGVQAIINNVLSRIASAPAACNDTSESQCSRNVVLLHDSGGDRSQTVAALPILIDTLRAHGYRFVAVSELAGLSWDMVQGTNLQHALMLASRHLARHPDAEPVVMVVTDGEPTAHLLADGSAWFDWPTHPETLAVTMAEVERITRRGATINVFMLDDEPGLVRFVDSVAKRNGGRVFTSDADRLGEYVVSDYIRARKGPRASA